MDRELDKRIAEGLRGQGWYIKEIADLLHVARSTVGEWLTDPDGSKAAARKERYRRPCIDGCGRLVSGSNGLGPKAPLRCRHCGIKRVVQGNRDRGRENREYLTMLWNAGFKVEYIADELGWTVGSVRAMVSRLRAEGADLVYRHHFEQRDIEAARDRMRQFRASGGILAGVH